VVDDNHDHRALLANLLTPLGFNIVEASDGESASTLALKPDLVLLDVKLGKVSGWDVAEALFKRFERLPIIMVSANARGFYNSMPSKKFHDDYLEKPLQLDALLEKVGSLLNIQWTFKSEQRNSANKKAKSLPTKNNVLQIDSELQQVINLAKIGNLNDLLICLNQIENSQCLPNHIVTDMRLLANRFDFNGVVALASRIQADTQSETHSTE
jgi:DNA-binding response OmpR family regulator